jgi:hypothetical protein
MNKLTDDQIFALTVLSDLLRERTSLLQERTKLSRRLSVIRQASPVLGRRILRSRSRQVVPTPPHQAPEPAMVSVGVLHVSDFRGFENCEFQQTEDLPPGRYELFCDPHNHSINGESN